MWLRLKTVDPLTSQPIGKGSWSDPYSAESSFFRALPCNFQSPEAHEQGPLIHEVTVPFET